MCAVLAHYHLCAVGRCSTLTIRCYRQLLQSLLNTSGAIRGRPIFKAGVPLYRVCGAYWAPARYMLSTAGRPIKHGMYTAKPSEHM